MNEDHSTVQDMKLVECSRKIYKPKVILLKQRVRQNYWRIT